MVDAPYVVIQGASGSPTDVGYQFTPVPLTQFLFKRWQSLFNNFTLLETIVNFEIYFASDTNLEVAECVVAPILVTDLEQTPLPTLPSFDKIAAIPGSKTTVFAPRADRGFVHTFRMKFVRPLAVATISSDGQPWPQQYMIFNLWFRTLTPGGQQGKTNFVCRAEVRNHVLFSQLRPDGDALETQTTLDFVPLVVSNPEPQYEVVPRTSAAPKPAVTTLRR